jgi:hypothetical protein
MTKPNLRRNVRIELSGNSGLDEDLRDVYALLANRSALARQLEGLRHGDIVAALTKPSVVRIFSVLTNEKMRAENAAAIGERGE